jgi:hypothetical protein
MRTAVQATNLEGLARLLQLDGFVCTPLATVQGKTVPLLVERGSHGALIGTQSGLLEADWNGHSLASMLSSGRVQGRVLNDYILRRNLPDEHQLVRSIIPS